MNIRVILGVLIAGIGGIVVETMDFRTVVYGFCMAVGALLISGGLEDETRAKPYR